jgi:dTMP kinase
MRHEGLDVVEVREPGGTPVAEAARAVVLDPSIEACAESELFLILTARADLVSRVIRPALTAGKVVLGDRYDLSTRAYQVAGRQLPAEQVATANRLATGGLVPHLTIVLDAPVQVVRERQGAQGRERDRIEQAERDVQERIAQAFLAAEGPGIAHIDASGSPDAVEEASWQLVKQVLAGTRAGEAG